MSNWGRDIAERIKKRREHLKRLSCVTCFSDGCLVFHVNFRKRSVDKVEKK